VLENKSRNNKLTHTRLKKSRKPTSTQRGTEETLAEDKLNKIQVYYKHLKEYIRFHMINLENGKIQCHSSKEIMVQNAVI